MREKKKESEAAKVQIKGQIEMEQEAKRRREAIKLLRQQEAQDRSELKYWCAFDLMMKAPFASLTHVRKWREKKLASERARALREEEVRQARAEQVRHRVEAAKREAEEESQFWQKTKELWMRENEKEELERLKVAQVRLHTLVMTTSTAMTGTMKADFLTLKRLVERTFKTFSVRWRRTH